MSRRLRGLVSFTYLADSEMYPVPSARAMASQDEQECYDDLSTLFELMESSEDLDISIVPVVAAVPDVEYDFEEEG